MISSFRNMIKYAIKTLAGDDSGAYPAGHKCQYNGKESQYMIMTPYGLFSNAPKDAFLALFSVQGEESNKFGIESTPDKRFKNLKPGEVAIGNVLSRTVTIYKENGDMDIVVTGDNGDLNLTIKKDKNTTVGGNSTTTLNNGNIALTVSGTGTYDYGGDVSFTSTGVTFDTPLVTMTGNLKVDGDIKSDGDIEDGGGIVLGSHIHPHGTPNTGPPV